MSGRIFAVLVWCLLVLTPLAARAAAPAFHAELASHWAPVIRQETASDRADFITKFDYDGNWNGRDNWENLDRFPLPAYVYYSVVESRSHWFIVYAFFHPRDWYKVSIPRLNHENDLEGIQLVVEKDGTPYGKLLAMDTIAHSHINGYSNDSSVSAGTSELGGKVAFADGHPVVDVEDHKHPVTAWDGKGKLELDGVVYRPGATAAIPRGKNDPNCPYALLSIEETLWARRFEVGKDKTFGATRVFPSGTFGGAFNGDNYAENSADAPWCWGDSDDKPLHPGDWAQDPGFAYSVRFKLARPIDVNYIYNPYLPGHGAGWIARKALFEKLHPLVP